MCACELRHRIGLRRQTKDSGVLHLFPFVLCTLPQHLETSPISVAPGRKQCQSVVPSYFRPRDPYWSDTRLVRQGHAPRTYRKYAYLTTSPSTPEGAPRCYLYCRRTIYEHHVGWTRHSQVRGIRSGLEGADGVAMSKFGLFLPEQAYPLILENPVTRLECSRDSKG